ncbi:DUF3853 family protein [Myroides odoratimimus]|nr:DUF3853 family protein [Myroides odoratimimus]
MYLNELKEKPVWQMTGQELLNLCIHPTKPIFHKLT